jgi:hypothetical protein
MDHVRQQLRLHPDSQKLDQFALHSLFYKDVVSVTQGFHESRLEDGDDYYYLQLRCDWRDSPLHGIKDGNLQLL